MDLFSGVLPFVRVAETGTFTGAAEVMGVTPAAVSKAVARLETELGARLFARTSRRVALTPEGRAFLERCRGAVALVEAGRGAVVDARDEPRGTVRVSASVILGASLVPVVADLALRHPELHVQVSLDDRVSRLVDDDVDVALRVGPLPERGEVNVLPLRQTRWVALAGHAYLARHGVPRVPADLARHRCVRFVDPRGRARDFLFTVRGRVTSVAVTGPVTVNHGDMLMRLARQGAGVVQVLDFMVPPRAELEDAGLQEVLAEHAAPGPPVFALTLGGRRAPPRVRVVVQALAQAWARRVD